MDDVDVHLSDKGVVSLLEGDVSRTLGPQYVGVVRATAKNVADLEIDDRGEKIVNDVQQFFHDTFVDTTWPACPRHASHPLWYRDGSWWCDADHVKVTPLGGLVAGG
jgi:hypothetical protein